MSQEDVIHILSERGLLLFGRHHKILISNYNDDKKMCNKNDGCIIIPVQYGRDAFEMLRFLRNLIKSMLRDVVDKIISEYAMKTNVRPSYVMILSMKRKWASCSINNVISLNLALAALPLHLIRFVIAHEFAHIFERRHTNEFWKIVTYLCGQIDINELREYEKKIAEDPVWSLILANNSTFKHA